MKKPSLIHNNFPRVYSHSHSDELISSTAVVHFALSLMHSHTQNLGLELGTLESVVPFVGLCLSYSFPLSCVQGHSLLWPVGTVKFYIKSSPRNESRVWKILIPWEIYFPQLYVCYLGLTHLATALSGKDQKTHGIVGLLIPVKCNTGLILKLFLEHFYPCGERDMSLIH